MKSKKALKGNKKGMRGLGEGVKYVKPAFTADRFLVYAGGVAVLGAGGYVIYRFIKAGLDNLDNKNSDSDSQRKNSTNVASFVAVPGQGKVPASSEFPISARNLNNPPYEQSVQWLQDLLIQGEGISILPRWRADGKFGYETLNAVRKVFGKDSVGKNDYLEYHNRVASRTNVNDRVYIVDEQQYKSLINKVNGLSGFSAQKLLSGGVKGLGCMCNN